MTIFAALALNLTVSGYCIAARQPPPLATRVVHCVVRTLEMGRIAAAGEPFDWHILKGRPHLTTVPGISGGYLRCDGTPLVLVYGRGMNGMEGGPFLGVAPLGFAGSTITHRDIFDRLQGSWRSHGSLYVHWPSGLLRLYPFEAVMVIQGNVMRYGVNLLALEYFITASRRAGVATIAVDSPGLIDKLVFAAYPSAVTGRRYLIPVGGDLLTLTPAGRGWVEVGFWHREP